LWKLKLKDKIKLVQYKLLIIIIIINMYRENVKREDVAAEDSWILILL